MKEFKIAVIGCASALLVERAMRAVERAGKSVVIWESDPANGRIISGSPELMQNSENQQNNLEKSLVIPYKNHIFDENLTVINLSAGKERSRYKRGQKYAKRKFF